MGDLPSVDDGQFLPLPFYPFEERPSHMAVDVEEAATAIYLAKGDFAEAAQRLRVTEYRLSGVVRRSIRLQRLLEDFGHVLVHKAVGIVARALDSEDFRRQEWGASKVLGSKVARDHFLAPAGDGGNVTVNAEGSNIVFRWRTEPPADGMKQIDSDE